MPCFNLTTRDKLRNSYFEFETRGYSEIYILGLTFSVLSVLNIQYMSG